MDQRSRASRDLAAYIEKRDAALARARQLRLLKQMGNDDRSEESRSKPIQALRSVSHNHQKRDDSNEIYSRLNELENNYRSLNSDNARLHQTVQKLNQKVASLELQMSSSAPALSSPSFSTAEGYEPIPSYSRKSSCRKLQNHSPPPMDFSLNPPNDESPGYTTPTRSRRTGRPNCQVMNGPASLTERAFVRTRPSTMDDLPISPSGETGAGSRSLEQGALQDRPEPLFPCATCGRRFRAESLQKHADNCVRVFQTKRKEFKVEVLNQEDASQLKHVYRPVNPSPAKKGIPKWRQDRARLRQTLLGGSHRESMEVQDSRLTCPHCLRKFDGSAAERHIPKCKNVVNKPAMLLRKPTRF